MKEAKITVQHTNNGYILWLGSESYVYHDEIDLLEMIKEFLELEGGGPIEIKRVEK